MKKYSLNKIPMMLASLGLFAGIQAQETTFDKVPTDCSSLCADKPNFDCSKDFEIMGAAVYEQVRVQGGEPAFLTYDRNQTLYPINGFGVQQPEFGSWGFKLGAFYSGWSDDWKTGVKYFYFQAISDSSVQNAYGSVFIPSVYANQFLDNNTELTTTGFANLQLGNKTIINDIKIVLGRPTLITGRVSLDTYSTVDITILSRRQVQFYTNDVTQGVAPIANPRFSTAVGGYFQNYQKYTWWGVGPGIGSRCMYSLGKGVAVYADGAGSIKYGCISSRTSTVSSPKVGLDPGNEAIMLSNLYQFSPGIDIELGFSWSYSFDEDQTRVNFNIAYESGFYFMAMRSVVPDINTRTENGAGLGVQGLVLEAGIQF